MSQIDSLDDVITFIKVIDLNSFLAAGRALGISSSLVSKRVTRLEETLQTQLLRRSTRRLHLTEAGRRYYQKVKSIPTILADASEEILPLGDAMQGDLLLIIPHGFDNSIRHHLIPEFVSAYPDIRLTVKTVDNPWDYIAEPFDVLITGKPPHKRFPDSSLMTRRILDLPAGIFATNTYLSKHGIPKVPEDVLKHRCISFFDNDDWLFLDKKKQLYSLAVEQVFHSNSSLLLTSITESDQALCYGFDFMFFESLLGGTVVKVLEEFVPRTLLEIFMFYPKTEYLPVKRRALLDAIIDVYQHYQQQLD